MNGAYALYQSLDPAAAVAGGFAATPYPGYPSHRVAVNADGDAVILLCTRVELRSRVQLPVQTQYIAVAFATSYRVQYPTGDAQEEVFSAVTCLSADPPIVRYFFDVLGGLIDSLGANPRLDEVDAALRSASLLFQALVLPATKTVQGIWAELLIIASSHDMPRAAAAWHAVPEERYDFAIGGERVEVKSVGFRRRIHHFALEQLTPPRASQLWIASLYVERSAGGLTLEELLREIAAGVEASESVRTRRVTAECLGASLTNALEMGFDRQLAIESLRYYPSALVPRVPTPLPHEVSDVHFRADLTSVPPAPLTGASAAIFPAPGASKE